MSYQDEINQARAQLQYLNRRTSGVNNALKTATNKAVVEALKAELVTIQNDINAENRKIRNAEEAIRRGMER